MIPDHPQRELLLAYADQVLDPARLEEVELLLQTDPEAEKFVSLLRTSEFPYQESFESLLKLPLPDHLTEKLDSSDPLPAELKQRKVYWKSSTAGLVVGVIGAAVFFNLLSPTSLPPIVDNVSQYQSLYQRDTVLTAPRPDLAAVEKMMNTYLGKEIKIPDLSDQKLTFKRGQLLQFQGRPLIQLVYLAEEGVPVALCITPAGELGNTMPEFGKGHGLDYGYWRYAGFEFVLVGDQHNSVAGLAESVIAEIKI